jgi:hypothetical protein
MGFYLRNCLIVFQLLSVAMFASGTVRAQSLSSKLSQKADFVPTASSPKEQLVELARHYKLPIGIEWIYAADQPATPLSFSGQITVMEMIRAILQQVPGYELRIENGVVSITYSSLSANPYDFLNLRMAEYKVNEVNVFGAEAQLRLTIDRTLRPERYVGGSAGGYGYGPDRNDGFDIKNISVSRKQISVRQVLDEIIRQNGNALWIVELNPSQTMKVAPFFAQRSHGGDVQTHFVWQIIPLTSHDFVNRLNYRMKRNRSSRFAKDCTLSALRAGQTEDMDTGS